MLLLRVTSQMTGISHHPFLPAESALQPEGLLHTRGMAGSGLPPLSNIPTAASRRSLGRVSVPVWLIILSDQLRIVAMVSRYLTIQLIRHRLICQRKVRRSPAFPRRAYAVLIRVSPGCPPLSGRFLCVTHPSAARQQSSKLLPVTARLACVKPAASVQSEP